MFHANVSLLCPPSASEPFRYWHGPEMYSWKGEGMANKSCLSGSMQPFGWGRTSKVPFARKNFTGKYFLHFLSLGEAIEAFMKPVAVYTVHMLLSDLFACLATGQVSS